MVNRPVGPPSGPPVPTDGDRFLGSVSGLGVCPTARTERTKITSAQRSTLVASLIAFLLRYKVVHPNPEGAVRQLVRIRMPARSISPLPVGFGRSNYQRQLNVNNTVVAPAPVNLVERRNLRGVPNTY